MSDERAIYQALLHAKDSDEPVLLATIVRGRGSIPRKAGAKMLVYGDGRILGTIGGGELEARVIEAAPALLESGTAKMMHVDLVDPAEGDAGVCGGEVEVFLEPQLPPPSILVIGCGHVGQALADLAHWVGFRVIVSDDRADLCNPDVIPQADRYIVAAPDDVTTHLRIHRRTMIAAVTRNMNVDLALLPRLMETEAAYIGVIGSRRRWAVTAQALRERGLAERELARIHAPIGLELNAETPREIAVSIIAEMMATLNKSSAESMQWLGAAQSA
ncbi:MAG: XdhC family protein [Chloroflexi bacterium]|nr:XdhC family protein [Chloroflexota bacterium]